MIKETLVRKKDPIISKLPCPLERKVEAAHYLAQTMRLSREPGSGIVGINFYEDEGDVNATVFEKTVPRTEAIRNMGHNERMKALWAEFTRLEEAVDQVIGSKNIEIIVLGGSKPEDIDEERDFYLGRRIAQWKPGVTLAEGEVKILK